jgi:hypothetical protein
LFDSEFFFPISTGAGCCANELLLLRKLENINATVRPHIIALPPLHHIEH